MCSRALIPSNCAATALATVLSVSPVASEIRWRWYSRVIPSSRIHAQCVAHAWENGKRLHDPQPYPQAFLPLLPLRKVRYQAYLGPLGPAFSTKSTSQHHHHHESLKIAKVMKNENKTPLLTVLKKQEVRPAPVWLMRQA